MKTLDFVGAQETHGAEGKLKAVTPHSSCCALWSHGESQRAGIGLIVKEEFLNKFNLMDTANDWLELVPGRVGMLRLDGPSGALDLAVVYLDA